MRSDRPVQMQDPDALAQAIIDKVDGRVVLALPLGLGKANHVVNALFARAMADRSISLSIFTALTLERPRPKSELEARFLNPVIERLFGGYPDLAYAAAQRAGTLPPNIEVDEFFFQAGTRLNVASAQQSYISANYTHAAGYLLARGFNVLAQLVARRGAGEAARYSLSCNTDITLTMLDARKAGRIDFLMVGQVNDELPFMPGEGDLPASTFSHVLDGPAVQFPLFAPPKEPISDSDYAVGFHVAGLVPDGGTLQLGIGGIGDAVAQALIVRHQQPQAFAETVVRLGAENARPAHAEPFDTGLYACTEMFVDCLLNLIEAGILKREVDGAVMHGGFFLGPKAFYSALREMDPARLQRLQMTSVAFTNELYGGETAKRAARRGARFVNSAMMATLMGAAISDGLEDGRVVSGVGGQYNFVAQAFALEDARSIMTLSAARAAKSNIRWSYGHETIPRHLRDVVVTEYGVADLRGKTDQAVIAAMLDIADSRFQQDLLKQAKDAGKISRTYQIAPAHRENTPERIAHALQPAKAVGLALAFPFGSDFNAVELSLLPALARLQQAQSSALALAGLAARGLTGARQTGAEARLARMGLDRPQSFKDRFYSALLRGAMSAGGAS